MITRSRFKMILILAAVVTLSVASSVQAETYEWLKSPEYKSIFVLTDFKESSFIADRLNGIVKETFSHSNIKTTISNSLVFQTKGKSGNSILELMDDQQDNELLSNNKVMLYVYCECIKYSSGFIYQFDIHFGVKDEKYSQALLYSAPQYSIVGVDSISGIDRTFRTLLQKVVNDYGSSNQQ